MESTPTSFRLRPAALDYLDALARYHALSRRGLIERMLVRSRPPRDCPGCIETHERLASIHGALGVIAAERQAEQAQIRATPVFLPLDDDNMIPDGKFAGLSINAPATVDAPTATVGQMLVEAGLVTEARASVALDGETQSVEPLDTTDLPADLDMKRARSIYDDPRTPAHLKARIRSRLSECQHKRYKTLNGGLRMCDDCKRTRNAYGEWSAL